jgi:PrcB C-terminal
MKISHRPLWAIAAGLTVVPFMTLAQGGGDLPFWRMHNSPINTGFNQPADKVVTSKKEFARVWSQVYANFSPQPKVPAIDFSKEMILVIAMGQQTSGGHSIRVERIWDNGGERTGVISMGHSPGKGCMTPASMTAPVEIVRLERPRKPIKFYRELLVKDCN